MNRYKLAKFIFFCAPFLVCGCGFHADQHGGGKVARVYYRDFNSESPFSLSENALISMSDERLEFDRQKDVMEIEELISIPCAREVSANVNARLVIHFLDDGKLERVWIASRFFFYDSKYRRACELPEGAGQVIVSSIRRIGSVVAHEVRPAASRS